MFKLEIFKASDPGAARRGTGEPRRRDDVEPRLRRDRDLASEPQPEPTNNEQVQPQYTAAKLLPTQRHSALRSSASSSR